jgi:hypothetical protein
MFIHVAASPPRRGGENLGPLRSSQPLLDFDGKKDDQTA